VSNARERVADNAHWQPLIRELEVLRHLSGGADSRANR
jgi:hypothetical protein